MSSETFEIISKVENSEMFLFCATKNLQFLKEAMEREILACKKANMFPRPEYMEDLCDAMCTALRELGQIQAELDAIVTAAYERKEG